MIFVYLIVMSMALLGLSFVLYRHNIELFLCLLITVYYGFYYMLPDFGYAILLLPMLLILFFLEFIGGKLSLGRYGWWVIGLFGISILGIAVASFAGQDVVTGIKAAKLIPLALVYFLIAGREINAGRFAKYFIVMAVCVAGLAALSFMTHGKLNFFPGIPQYMFVDKIMGKVGWTRITIGQQVISAAAVIAFARFRQRDGIWYLIAAVALFAEVLIVQQTRGFIAGVFVSLIVVYVLSLRLTVAGIVLYLFLIGVALAVSMAVSMTDLGSISFVKKTQSDMSRRDGKYGNSLQARLNGYTYYWEQIVKQPITGRGLLNLNWAGNPDRRLQEYGGIHLTDIGIMQYLVQAGLVGFVWMLYGLLKMWKDLLVFREQLFIGCYFILGTFTMPTLDMFMLMDQSLFLFVLFLGVSSSIIMAAKRKSVTEERTDNAHEWFEPHYATSGNQGGPIDVDHR